MKLPTIKQCIEILDECNVPQNIREHIFAVNRVAVFLAKKLKEAGEEVNVDLVDKASLLHDSDKISTLGTGTHGRLAEEILSKKGYPEVGKIVRKHKLSSIRDNGLKTWEEKIVNYADKRCNNGIIVLLKERFCDLRERYKDSIHPDSENLENLFLELEKDIFSRIKMKPEDLKKFVKEE